MSAPKYQLLDPLTEQQYADLREDIRESGILQPIAVDEFGVVIDGHHRQRIAEELGIDYPTHQPLAAGASDGEKLDTAMKLNLMGRHQTDEQKRETIKRYLLRRPEAADRYVARLLGLSHQTVGRIRAELVASGPLDQMPERITERAGKPFKQKLRSKPDPEAVAKRQAELEAKRAKAAPKQAAKRAEQEAQEAEWRAAHEAIGGSARKTSKPAARVIATQDRIKAAMNDCILALTRALQDPGLDVDLMAAEQALAPDFRIIAVRRRLQARLGELTKRLAALDAERIRAEKASRMSRESPVRE